MSKRTNSFLQMVFWVAFLFSAIFWKLGNTADCAEFLEPEKDIVVHLDSFWVDSAIEKSVLNAYLTGYNRLPDDSRFVIPTVDPVNGNEIQNDFRSSFLYYRGIDFNEGNAFLYQPELTNGCIDNGCRVNLVFYTDTIDKQMERGDVGLPVEAIDQGYYLRVPAILQYSEGQIEIYRNCNDADFPGVDNHQVVFLGGQQPPTGWDAHEAQAYDASEMFGPLTSAFLEVSYDNNRYFSLDETSIGNMVDTVNDYLEHLLGANRFRIQDWAEWKIEAYATAIDNGYYPPQFDLSDAQLAQRTGQDGSYLYLGYHVHMFSGNRIPVDYRNNHFSQASFMEYKNQFKECENDCRLEYQGVTTIDAKWEWQNSSDDNERFQEEYEMPIDLITDNSGNMKKNLVSFAVDAKLVQAIWSDILLQALYTQILTNRGISKKLRDQMTFYAKFTQGTFPDVNGAMNSFMELRTKAKFCDSWVGYDPCVTVTATIPVDVFQGNFGCINIPEPRIHLNKNWVLKFYEGAMKYLLKPIMYLGAGYLEYLNILTLGNVFDPGTLVHGVSGLPDSVEDIFRQQLNVFDENKKYACISVDPLEQIANFICKHTSIGGCYEKITTGIDWNRHIYFAAPGEGEDRFKYGILASVGLATDSRYELHRLMGIALPDFDGDGLVGSDDPCPEYFNEPGTIDFSDRDGDGYVDICDNCPPELLPNGEYCGRNDQSNFDWWVENANKPDDWEYSYFEGDVCDMNDDEDYWWDGSGEIGRQQYMTECGNSPKYESTSYSTGCYCQANYDPSQCLRSKQGVICQNGYCVCDCDNDMIEEAGPGGPDDHMTEVWSEKGFDNCPRKPNPLQGNSDQDWHGDACDNCPYDDNPRQEDDDNDWVGNVCDNCGPDKRGKDQWNPLQLNFDDPDDGTGNTCDEDPMVYLQAQMCDEEMVFSGTNWNPYYALQNNSGSENHSVVIQYCDCNRLVDHSDDSQLDTAIIASAYYELERDNFDSHGDYIAAKMDRCKEYICDDDSPWTVNPEHPNLPQYRKWSNVNMQERLFEDDPNLVWPGEPTPDLGCALAEKAEWELMKKRAYNPCPEQWGTDVFSSPERGSDANRYFCGVCFSAQDELGTPGVANWLWQEQLKSERNYPADYFGNEENEDPLILFRISYVEQPHLAGLDRDEIETQLQDHYHPEPYFPDARDISDSLTTNVCLREDLLRARKPEVEYFDSTGLMEEYRKMQMREWVKWPPNVDPPISDLITENFRYGVLDLYGNDYYEYKNAPAFTEVIQNSTTAASNPGIDLQTMKTGIESTIVFGGTSAASGERSEGSSRDGQLTNEVYQIFKLPGQEAEIISLTADCDSTSSVVVCPIATKYANVFGVGLHSQREEIVGFDYPPENRVIVYGGLSENGMCLAQYMLYEDGRWSTIGKKYQTPPRCFADAGKTQTKLGGYIVVGGSYSNQETRSEVHYFDPGTLVWQALPNLPQGRTGPSVYYDSDYKRIYVFGGVVDGGEYRNDLLMLDLNDPSLGWQTIVSQCVDDNCIAGRAYAKLFKHPHENKLSLVGGSVSATDIGQGGRSFEWSLDLNNIDLGWTAPDYEWSGIDCDQDGREDLTIGMKCRKERKNWYDPLGVNSCDLSNNSFTCEVPERDSHWVGTYITLRKQYEFDIKGSYAYIGSENGVDIVYVGLDYLPLRFGWWPTVGQVNDISIEDDNLLYLVDGDGLKLLDVGFSVLPIPKGGVSLSNPGVAFAVSGNLIYVVSGENIEIITRSGDWALVHIGSVSTNMACSDIVIENQTLFIACTDGIKRFNLSNPQNPVLQETIYTDKAALFLRSDGKFLYSIEFGGGYVAYQIGSSGTLRKAGKHNVDNWVDGVSYWDDRVYFINWAWLNMRKYE